MRLETREQLVEALNGYSTWYDTENKFCKQFLKLLTSPRCYHRDHLPGHLTGSAFIIDQSASFALLTHHAKLNKWLQPGGHADGDEDIFRVALREAEEETGLKNFSVLMPSLFDIDIHTIPARKDFPEHLHYDVRILLQVSREEKFTISEESHDMKWIPLEEIAPMTENDSLTRMVEKVRSIFPPSRYGK